MTNKNRATVGALIGVGLLAFGTLRNADALLRLVERFKSYPEPTDVVPPPPLPAERAWERCTADDAPPNDDSLELSAYAERGLPSMNVPWNANQAATATHVAMAEVRSTTLMHMPRWCSPRSGALFERITSDARMRRVVESSMPLERKAAAIQQELAAVEPLVAYERDGGPTYQLEVARLVGFNLRLNTELLRLVRPKIASADGKDVDEWAASSLKGFDSMLRVIEDRKTYRRRVRHLYASYLAENLGELIAGFPEGRLRPVIPQLERVTASETDPEIRALLAGIRR